MAAPFVSVLSRNVTPTLSSLVRKFFFFFLQSFTARLEWSHQILPPTILPPATFLTPQQLSLHEEEGVDLDQYDSLSCFLYLRHFSFLNFLPRSNFPSSCPPFIIYCFCSSLFSTLYSVFNSLSFDPLFFRPFFHFSPYLSPFSTLTFPWIFLSSYFLTCTAFFHLLLFLL